MANADDMFAELLGTHGPPKITKSISQQKQELQTKIEEVEKVGANADLMARLGYLDIATDFAGVSAEVKEQIKVTDKKIVKRNEDEIKAAKARRNKVNGVKNYIKIHSFRNKLGIKPHDHITIIRKYAKEKTPFMDEALNTPVLVLCEIIQDEFSKFKYWMFQNYK